MRNFSVFLAMTMVLMACAPSDEVVSEETQEVMTSCQAGCTLGDGQAYLGCRTACNDPGFPFTSYCANVEGSGVCVWDPHACGYTPDGVCHRWYEGLCGGLVCPPGSPL